ncbi:CLUMA_CG008413, isoform A [Clunio marinus]|uniref:CLUMA_CG008413, isoform A n=1 Tax=Clunio marinus TaxID=568069 RepID=A0A1J1I593_9DIPT|nr:CLUMA_CG008413, isoform A [Clunio marinus]
MKELLSKPSEENRHALRKLNLYLLNKLETAKFIKENKSLEPSLIQKISITRQGQNDGELYNADVKRKR